MTEYWIPFKHAPYSIVPRTAGCQDCIDMTSHAALYAVETKCKILRRARVDKIVLKVEGGCRESEAQTMEPKRVSQKDRFRRGAAFRYAFCRGENRAGAIFVS
jgi:hypothetical protein